MSKIYKLIGSFVDPHDVTETPIKVEMDKRGIVFIARRNKDDDQITVLSKTAVPQLIEILQKITA